MITSERVRNLLRSGNSVPRSRVIAPGEDFRELSLDEMLSDPILLKRMAADGVRAQDLRDLATAFRRARGRAGHPTTRRNDHVNAPSSPVHTGGD